MSFVEVVATMMAWNNVSLASPYLLRCSIWHQWRGSESLVCHLLFFFRFWLLLCLSEETVGWLSMRQSRPLHLICSTARSDIFNMILWWWKIVSLRPLEVFFHLMFSEWILDYVVKRRVAFSVFKALFRESVCRCSFFSFFTVRSLNSSSQWTFQGRRWHIWSLMYSYF
jgi:hypothetical protein